MNFGLIDKAIYDWVNAITKRKVIWLMQNAPRPSLPYITLHKTALIPIGHDFLSLPDSNGKSKLGGVRNLILRVSSYGSNSMGIIELLSTSFWIDKYRDILRAEGISFLNRLAINDLTELIDTRYEERVQADFSLLIGRESTTDDEIDTGIIELVQGTGTIEPEEKEIEIDVDAS